MKKIWKIYIIVNVLIIAALLVTGVVDYLIGKIVLGLCAGLLVSGLMKLRK